MEAGYQVDNKINLKEFMLTGKTFSLGGDWVPVTKEFKFKDIVISTTEYRVKFDVELYCPICKKKFNIGDEATYISSGNELFPNIDCHIRCLSNGIDDNIISYLANYYNDLLLSLKIWFPNHPDEIKNLLGNDYSITDLVEKKVSSLAGSLLKKSFDSGKEINIPSLGIKVKKDEPIIEKKFLEYEEPTTNKERFKKDFHCGALYNKLKELRKNSHTKYKKYKELLKGSKFYSPSAWEMAYTEYKSFTEKYPDAIHNMSLGAYETIYVSVVAHYKGKLHMKTVEWKSLSNMIEPYSFWGGSLDDHYIDKGRQIFKWTMEDQERLIEKFLIPYR